MSTYQTSDFVEGPMLVMLHHRLCGVDRKNPKRVVFAFEDTPKLREDIGKLNTGKLLVNPFDFWTAQRRCKQLIYGKEEYGA